MVATAPFPASLTRSGHHGRCVAFRRRRSDCSTAPAGEKVGRALDTSPRLAARRRLLGVFPAGVHWARQRRGPCLGRRGGVTTPTDENRDLLTVVAYMCAAEGKTEKLRARARSADRADQPGRGVRQLRPRPGRRRPLASSPSTRIGSPVPTSTPTSQRPTWSTSRTRWVTSSTRTARA